MADQRKAFLLRMDPKVLDALQHWADDDLRSLNGQIEFLLRSALIEHKRLKDKSIGQSNRKSNEKGDKT